MKVVNPYLNFKGDTEEAFKFYRSVFGGEFALVIRMKDVPGMEIPESAGDKIMHISLPLETGQILMGSDTPEQMEYVKGNNTYISIHAESQEEGSGLFDKLSDGGSHLLPYGKQFWGAWHGHLTDKYGIGWIVNYDPPL